MTSSKILAKKAPEKKPMECPWATSPGFWTILQRPVEKRTKPSTAQERKQEVTEFFETSLPNSCKYNDVGFWQAVHINPSTL